MKRLVMAAGALGLVLSGCAGQAVGTPKSWYAYRNAVAPSSAKVVICHGFGCAWRTPVSFSSADMKQLASILKNGASSPQAERAAISRAVQWQEKRVAPVVGSANDAGGFDAQNAGVRGQMDCIDEATNTTSLLVVAEKAGLLTHHSVRSPVARGFFLDGRYPHATAVVTEKAAGKSFAVDSWPHANGVAPDIMPLDTWFAKYPGDA
ncbi:hypothetical protein [Breoghania sp. L-A4]|uniref:hypothetical protein n=1 Tax=Breoghania sp. L-A4 TaxID=2304600 RepID=UPI000E35D671|nr:hypothetical protein [Breoghania sp. L-A4]AXS40546.1 hypothetical protein D1F64_11360 [Breoghania sp. L-A4]